ncbi:hypothetical protein [Duganella guangzhouensis]|nr:hypothetical protein [Duganella guangzhouensis]
MSRTKLTPEPVNIFVPDNLHWCRGFSIAVFNIGTGNNHLFNWFAWVVPSVSATAAALVFIASFFILFPEVLLWKA